MQVLQRRACQVHATPSCPLLVGVRVRDAVRARARIGRRGVGGLLLGVELWLGNRDPGSGIRGPAPSSLPGYTPRVSRTYARGRRDRSAADGEGYRCPPFLRPPNSCSAVSSPAATGRNDQATRAIAPPPDRCGPPLVQPLCPSLSCVQRSCPEPTPARVATWTGGGAGARYHGKTPDCRLRLQKNIGSWALHVSGVSAPKAGDMLHSAPPPLPRRP